MSGKEKYEWEMRFNENLFLSIWTEEYCGNLIMFSLRLCELNSVLYVYVFISCCLLNTN